MTGLRLEQATTTTLKGSWNAVAGADSYTVQWLSRDAGHSGYASDRSVSRTTTDYTLTVPGLGSNDNARTWHLRVRPATSSGAVGAWSYASAILSRSPAPSNLRATAPTQSTVNLTWADPSSGSVTNFVVQFEASNGHVGEHIGPTTGTPTNRTFTVTGLSPGTTYRFSVRASSSGGLSEAATVTATTSAATTAPNAPTGLTATADGDDLIRLSWTAATSGAGATGYKVQFKTATTPWADVPVIRGANNLVLHDPAKSTRTSYDHRGLTSATTYSYRVQALNAIGASSVSTTASATTDGAQAVLEMQVDRPALRPAACRSATGWGRRAWISGRRSPPAATLPVRRGRGRSPSAIRAGSR